MHFFKKNISLGYKSVVYKAPDALTEKCQEQRIKRIEDMKEAFTSESPDSGKWVPDKQDLVDEQEVFIARDFTSQQNWAQAEIEMHPDSVDRMKRGLKPTRPEDKQWVAQTAE